MRYIACATSRALKVGPWLACCLMIAIYFYWLVTVVNYLGILHEFHWRSKFWSFLIKWKWRETYSKYQWTTTWKQRHRWIVYDVNLHKTRSEPRCVLSFVKAEALFVMWRKCVYIEPTKLFRMLKTLTVVFLVWFLVTALQISRTEDDIDHFPAVLKSSGLSKQSFFAKPHFL